MTNIEAIARRTAGEIALAYRTGEADPVAVTEYFLDRIEAARDDRAFIITAACDLDMGKRYRETIFDFARHREPEAYRLIVERKGAVPPPG